MTKGQVEVITSVQRRRRWTSGEKERLVAASLAPGAVVSALAREAGVHPSQLYGWRRRLCARAAADFTAVRIAAPPIAALAAPVPSGSIEIEFASGTRLRITGAVDTVTLSAAVAALALKEGAR